VVGRLLYRLSAYPLIDAPIFPVWDCLNQNALLLEFRFNIKSDKKRLSELIPFKEFEERLNVASAYSFLNLDLYRHDIFIMGMDNIDLLLLRGLQKELRIKAVYKELFQKSRQLGLRVQRQRECRVAGIQFFYLFLAGMKIPRIIIKLLQKQGVFKIGDSLFFFSLIADSCQLLIAV